MINVKDGRYQHNSRNSLAGSKVDVVAWFVVVIVCKLSVALPFFRQTVVECNHSERCIRGSGG